MSNSEIWFSYLTYATINKKIRLLKKKKELFNLEKRIIEFLVVKSVDRIMIDGNSVIFL